MKFNDVVPTKKGLYLMQIGLSTMRLMRVRGPREGEGSSEPGVLTKVYEFLDVASGEWTRINPFNQTNRTFSQRIRHAVGFKPEPVEAERKVVIELTHAQGQDDDLVRRIKAAGACWQVDMHHQLRESFKADYKEISKGMFMCNLASSSTPGRSFAADTTEMAWRIYKRVKGVS